MNTNTNLLRKAIANALPVVRWSAALVLGTASAAYAQSEQSQSTTSSEQLEEVVVVGLRASLEAAAEIKRSADQVVDSIVADDIGKFPDNTTAAALQRVPGVQVTVTDNNEIANPIIRGISDILTTLDGREIFTGVGRGYSFQDLPAEALGGADVFKSNSANLMEGGVAGVINMRLHKPFDFAPGWSGAINTRGIYGDNTEKLSGTIGGLLSNHWESGAGEMGALLNISYSDINFNRPISFNCDPRSGSNGPTGGAGVILPSCVGGLNQYGDYQRPQVNTAFQWRVNDQLEVYADGIYTEYKSRWETSYIFADVFGAESITDVEATDKCADYMVSDSGYGGGTDLQHLCIGKSATFNNVAGLTSTQAKDSGTEHYLVATGLRYNSGALHLDGDVSYQRSHNDNRTIIVDIGKQIDAVEVTVNSNKHGTTNMPGNPLGDADDFRFANSLYQDINDSLSTQFALAGNAAYDLEHDWFRQLQFGVRFADRDATYRANAAGGPNAPGGNRVTLVDSVGLPDDFLVRSPATIPYINGGQHWMVADRDFLLDQTDVLRAIYGSASGDPAYSPTKNFDATEKTYAGYLQGKYSIEVGNGLVVDGLIGGRLTRSDRQLSGTGLITPAPTDDNPNPSAEYTPVTTDVTDTDFLPNFSARLRLTPELQFRFTAARALARPTFSDLNPGLTYQVPANQNERPNGSGGNPDLKPQISNAFDATVEYYFARSSYVSAGLYYRDLKNRTVTQTNPETIDGVTYLISRPRNAAGATLQGIELAGQTFFDWLPGFWGGFGAMANFTLADSEITTKSDALEGEPLQGVSKYSYNLGLLYEEFGVTGRLVYTHRSHYTESVIGGALAPVGTTNVFNAVRDNGRLDFSLGYDVTDNVTASIDGTNLTRAKYYSYFNTTAFPHDVRDDERTLGVSLRGRF